MVLFKTPKHDTMMIDGPLACRRVTQLIWISWTIFKLGGGMMDEF